ncbi:MAG: alpha/beta hydrolase [Myroides sp.]|jgi:pimeloyl-ACP methyl ester carboxylesterase|nr:alpha/beta hydrolase [Myroides sp.]
MKTYFKTPKSKEIVLAYYQNILSKWPVANKQFKVQTSFGETFIIASGDIHLPPLILVHGSVSNSYTWFSDIEALSQSYRVYAIDIIGDAGLSDEARPSYKSGAYAKWLNEILQHLNIEKCYMAGLSLGGWMITHFAIKFPQKVTGLFLISPGGYAKTKASCLFKLFFFTLTRQNKKLIQLLNGGHTITPESKIDAAMKYTLLINKHFHPRREKLPIFTSQQLSKLTMPVQMVIGEKDCFFDARDVLYNLTQSASHTEGILLPDTGHIVINQAENMQRFFKPIKE